MGESSSGVSAGHCIQSTVFPAATFRGLVFLVQGQPERAIEQIKSEREESWRSDVLQVVVPASQIAKRKAESKAALRSADAYSKSGQ